MAFTDLGDVLRIPEQPEHRFRYKLDTDSGGKLNIFRVATGMGCGISVDSDAALENLV